MKGWKKIGLYYSDLFPAYKLRINQIKQVSERLGIEIANQFEYINILENGMNFTKLTDLFWNISKEII